MTLCLVSLVMALIFLGQVQSMAAEQMDTPRLTYDIEAQSLKSALEIYQKTSGLNLAYSDDLVQGKMTDGVDGKNTTDQALKKLLKDTGLTYTITNQGTVVLRKHKMVVAQREAEKREEVKKKEEGKRPVEMEQMVVTATRVETKLKDVPASISVITAEEIKLKGAHNAAEALVGQPNINIRWYTEGGTASVIMRGISHPHMNNNILFLVDGIPQVTPGDESYFENIPFDNIERIEVVKGPVSALYGRNSIAGAINFITKPPPHYWTGSVGTTYGSYDYLKPYFSVGGPLVKENGFIHLGGYYETYDGWRDRTEREASDFHIKNTWFFGKKSDMIIDLKYYNVDQDYATPIPLRGDGSVIDVSREANYNLPDGHVEDETTRLSLIWNQEFTSSLNLKTTVSYKHVDHGIYNDGTVFSLDEANTTLKRWALEGEYTENNLYFEPQLTWSAKLFGRGNRLICGVSYERSSGDDDGWFIEPCFWCPIPINYVTGEQDLSTLTKRQTRDSEYTIDLVGVYVQDEFNITEKLILTAGLRYDYYERDADYKAIGGNPATKVKGDFDHISPKIAFNYSWTENLSTYVSYAQGFHPTFGPLWSFTEDYKNLDPEIADNYEVGLKSHLFDRRLFLNAAGYFMKRKDLLVIVGSPPNLKPENAGEQEIYGVELETRWDLRDLLDGLNGFLNYSYTETEWTDYEYDTWGGHWDFTGKEAKGIPDHLLSLGLNYLHKPSGLGAGIWWDYVGKWYMDPANKYEADSYDILNARVSYSPEKWKWLEANIQALNITDKEYFSSMAGNEYGARAAVPGRPFTIFGNVTFSF